MTALSERVKVTATPGGVQRCTRMSLWPPQQAVSPPALASAQSPDPAPASSPAHVI